MALFRLGAITAVPKSLPRAFARLFRVGMLGVGAGVVTVAWETAGVGVSVITGVGETAGVGIGVVTGVGETAGVTG